MVEELKNELKAARQVLEFYAEDSNYYVMECASTGTIIIDDDNGQRAMEALERIDQLFADLEVNYG